MTMVEQQTDGWLGLLRPRAQTGVDGVEEGREQAADQSGKSEDEREPMGIHGDQRGGDIDASAL